MTCSLAIIGAWRQQGVQTCLQRKDQFSRPHAILTQAA